MRDLLLERVRAFLAEQGLLRPDALLLVAVSGGPDSLCLLHLLLRLRAADGPALHVAHLDHGTRGAESAAEAAAVSALAAAWGLPASVERRDVPALAGATRQGLPAAARQARYAFLADCALATGAHAVAVAHQADDQAETVLLHALRGAGLAGLRGMRPVVPWPEWAPEYVTLGVQSSAPLSRSPSAQPGGTEPAASLITLPEHNRAEHSTFCILHSAFLIRPLLTTSRAEIAAYCAAHDLRPTDDPSNRSPRFARARVRSMLPALAAENPRLVAALARTARLCADDYDYIQGQLDIIWPALAAERPGLLSLRRAPWDALHPALQRYALRRAAARLGQPELSMEQIEAARALAGHPGRQLRLGGALRLIIDHAGLILAHPEVAPYAGAPQIAVAELPLACPGANPIGAGWICLIGACPPAVPSRWWVALDQAALASPLSLRRRRPGDRFRPVGAPGSRKLQDFFVDRKLPRGLRDAWPLLVTPDAIVWVAGLRADARFVANPQSQSTIWVGLVRE